VAVNNATTISVVDFRRQTWCCNGMRSADLDGLRLAAGAGAWHCADQRQRPNICLYGQGGKLRLPGGPNHMRWRRIRPRISCTRGIATFGFAAASHREVGQRRRALSAIRTGPIKAGTSTVGWRITRRIPIGA